MHAKDRGGVVLLTHPLRARYGSPKVSRRALRGRIVIRRAVGLPPSHPPRRPLSRPYRSSYGTPQRVWGMTCREPDYPPLPAVPVRREHQGARGIESSNASMLPVPSPFPRRPLGASAGCAHPSGLTAVVWALARRVVGLACARHSPSRCAGSLPTAHRRASACGGSVYIRLARRSRSPAATSSPRTPLRWRQRPCAFGPPAAGP